MGEKMPQDWRAVCIGAFRGKEEVGLFYLLKGGMENVGNRARKRARRN